MKVMSSVLLYLVVIQMAQCFRYPSPIMHYHVYKRVAYQTEEPTEPTTINSTPEPVTTQPKVITKLRKYENTLAEAWKKFRKLFERSDPGFKLDYLQDLQKSRLTR